MAFMSLLGGALTSAVGYHVGRARADVPPSAERLFYSGIATSGGTPVSGNHLMAIQFFGSAQSSDELCAVPPVTLPFVNGQFRLNVSECADEIATAPDAFVQLLLDDTMLLPPVGTPRPRIGAVPYAIQALSATTADSVPTLEATVTDLSGAQLALGGRVTSLETAIDFTFASNRVVNSNTASANAVCPVGMRATGGGCSDSNCTGGSSTDPNTFVTRSEPGPDAWFCETRSTTAAPAATCARAFVVCMKHQ